MNKKQEIYFIVARLINDGSLSVKDLKEYTLYFELYDDLYRISDGKVFPTEKLLNTYKEIVK